MKKEVRSYRPHLLGSVTGVLHPGVKEPAVALGVFTIYGFLDSYSKVSAILIAPYPSIYVAGLYAFVKQVHQIPT